MVWNPLSLPEGQSVLPTPGVFQLHMFKTIDFSKNQTNNDYEEQENLSPFNSASGNNGTN